MELDIEFGHRTGKSRENAPRTVIMKLHSRLQKRKLMQKRKDFFSAGFPLFNDLPKQDLQEKLKHMDIMKTKFQNKQKVMFTRGSWYVDGVLFKGD